MKIRLFMLFACVCLVCAAACTDSEELGEPDQPAKTVVVEKVWTEFTHELTADAEYYSIGPQQSMPPNGTFKAGTKVVLIEDVGSYSKVQTEDGTAGFVSTDVLKPIE